MNNHDNTTDADMEAEFIERNNNLKRSLNNIIDKVDNAAKSTHDYLEAPEHRADADSSVADSGHLGAFKASGSPDNHGDTTSTSGIVNNRPSRTGYYDDDTSLSIGRNTATSGTLDDNLDTRRRPYSIIGEQTSRHGWGINLMDHKLMSSVKSDIHAMHSTDPDEFKDIAAKIDETFGNTALM